MGSEECGAGTLARELYPERGTKAACNSLVKQKSLLKFHLCSKSTGAVTSCTRKYLASAGCFRATASYIAYATLR